jgi:hypothetical protein
MITEISGKKYRLPQLDVFQEFALASTISPILALLSLQTDKTKLAAKFPQSFTALTGEMGLSRQAKDEIIQMCLSGVLREESASWLPVMSTSGQVMYQDMGLSVVLRLVWEILVQHKLIDFFSDPHSNSTEQPAGKQASSGSGTRTRG